MANTIWIVKEEYSIEENVNFNVYPCMTKGLAILMLENLKEIWNKTNTNFKGEIFNKQGRMKIDSSDEEYNIYDPCNDEYLNISIAEENFFTNAGDAENYKINQINGDTHQKTYKEFDNTAFVKSIIDLINFQGLIDKIGNVIETTNSVEGGFIEKMTKAKELYDTNGEGIASIDETNELMDCEYHYYNTTIIFTLVYNDKSNRIHLSSGLEIVWHDKTKHIDFIYEWNKDSGFVSDFYNSSDPTDTMECFYYLPSIARNVYEKNIKLFGK